MSLANWFRSVRNRVRGLARRPSRRASMLRLETLEDRITPSTVQGVVFDDANGDGIRQGGEAGLAGWTVFLDTDRDSILDAGEISTVTNSNGFYEFTSGIAPPRANVSLILQVDDPNQAPGRWVPITHYSVYVQIPDETTTDVADFGVQYHTYGAVATVGAETLANVTTAGAQTGPDVAADAQGNYVMVWRSDSSIIARLFNADGTAASGEIVVANSTTVRGTAKVAMADNGIFAVVWTTDNSSGNGVVYTRAYAANGTPLTAAVVQVTPNSNNVDNYGHDIAMDADGDYVVLFKGRKKSGFAWNEGLTGFQRYNELGQAVGNNTQVVDAQLINGKASVAMDNGGNFVVVWDDSGVLAQRYTSAGKKSGSQITVSSSGWQSSVAMNGSGKFVVTWNDNSGNDFAQRFSATGTPLGSLVQISTTGHDSPARAAIDDAGNVLFTWMRGFESAGSSYAPNLNPTTEIYFRRLTAAGGLEAEYVVNTTTQGLQQEPSIAITGTDSFVVSWSGYGAGDDAGVFFQRYGPAS